MQPSCLSDAYGYLAEGRAWVACLAHPQGVATIASKATVAEQIANPRSQRYLQPDCPKGDRVAFLLGGILEVERRVFL